MLCLCLAAGRAFLGIVVPKPRRVLLCQFEIRDHHFHRRVKRMARALGIDAHHIGDRLQVVNARGLGITGPEGIERIQTLAMEFKPELIGLDPLYKLSSGIENAAEDTKVLMNSFDVLAESSGAAIAYVHHDTKGSPGDKDIRDRGAGSNVLGRDYDACITLTPHSQDPDSSVLELLLRNYRPIDPFTISWASDDENGGYRFEMAPELFPEKKTSKTKSQAISFDAYLPSAFSILGSDEMEFALFRETFKKQTGLSDNRIRNFLAWATRDDNQYLSTREERGRGFFKKMIRATEAYK